MKFITLAIALGIPVALLWRKLRSPDFSGVYYPVNPFGNFAGAPESSSATRTPTETDRVRAGRRWIQWQASR